jgi:2,3-bisphosphoglycerate-independent phosphoglycerate mutase
VSAEGLSTAARRPVALIILDGWGHAPDGPGNAISLARTPVWDGLVARYPWVLLRASGEAVGLPAGVMGNSEVGHLTIGSGRVFYQDLSRINHAIADGSFVSNPVLVEAFRGGAAGGGAVHLMGLLSDGGVHADLDHVKALVRLAKAQGVSRLYLHPFMDGRDTSPFHGIELIEDLEAFLAAEGLGRIATVSGRYYAMDRDTRWDRTALAYAALVAGEGPRAETAAEAVRASYGAGITDEFVLPTVILAEPQARMRDGDTVVCFNFRPDRARQLTRALIQADFDAFPRGAGPPRVAFVSMTEYDATFGVPVAFPKDEPVHVLAEVIGHAGLRQLHIAETEKYAHVTFFFNGGREEPFPGERRCLVPSPTEVATYDQKPEMSCRQVADRFRQLFTEEPSDLVILNFANPDMVGHTGVLSATIAALQYVDACLGSVLEVLRAHDAHVLVTADHGNAEQMVAADGSPDTAHTTNPVPLVFLDEGRILREAAGLADIAPTILCLLGLDVPAEMTGVPLC